MSTSKDQHPNGSHFPNRGNRNSKINQKEQNMANTNYIQTQPSSKSGSTLILPAIFPSQLRNHVTTPPALFEDQYLPYQGDPSQVICLDISTMTGKTLRVSVLPTNTIRQVKQIIMNSHGIPISSQTLVFRNRPMRDAIMVYQYKLQNKSRVDLVLTLSGGHGPIPAALKLPSIKPSLSTPMRNFGNPQTFSTVLRNQTINVCDSQQSNCSTLLLLCRRDADYYLVEVKIDHGECIDATAQYLGGPELSSDDLDVIIQAMDHPPVLTPTFEMPNIAALPNSNSQRTSINFNEPEDLENNDLRQGVLDGLEEADWGSFGVYDDAEPMEYPVDLDSNDRPCSALSTTVSIPEDVAREFGLPIGNAHLVSNESNESSMKLQSVVQSTISSFIGKRLAARPATAIIITRIKSCSSTDFHPLLTTRIKSAPTNRRKPQSDVSIAMPAQQMTSVPTINHPVQVAAGVPYRKGDKNWIGSSKMPSRKDRCNPESQITVNPYLQHPESLAFTTPKERVSSSHAHKHAVTTPQQTKYCNMSKCTKLLRPMLVTVGATKCRCGYHYCQKHRASNVHACTFDYRGHEQLRLNKENPKIRGKLPLI